ncbi:MAG: hypothetical protein FJ290_33730 [Planctomycetes bacterium]|nr:hypothetical protein [Planctomycetota bacterium]
MSTATADRHELVRRGQAYYDQHLRAKLEPEHKGKFLALQPDSGEYEMDADEMAAIDRARARCPGRFFYILRIGYRAAHRIRARMRRGYTLSRHSKL